VEKLIRDRNATFNIANLRELKEWDKAGWALLEIDWDDHFARRGPKKYHHIPWMGRLDEYGMSLNATPSESLPPEHERMQKSKLLRFRAAQDFAVEFERLFGNSDIVSVIIISTSFVRAKNAIKALLPLRHKMQVKLAVYVMNKDFSPNDLHFFDEKILSGASRGGRDGPRRKW